MLEEKPKELNLEDPSRLALMTLLTWGTRCSFFLCLTGLVVMTWTAPPVSVGELPTIGDCELACWKTPGAAIILAGIISLIVVSAGRLILTAIMYLKAGDKVFSLLSIFALVLVLSSTLFAFFGW